MDLNRSALQTAPEKRCFPFLTMVYSACSIAEQDACRIEHVISDESFQKLKETLENERGGDSMGN